MASSAPKQSARLLRHEQRWLLAALVALTAVSWAWLGLGAGMAPMAGMAMTPPFAVVALMWSVMMAAKGGVIAMPAIGPMPAPRPSQAQLTAVSATSAARSQRCS